MQGGAEVKRLEGLEGWKEGLQLLWRPSAIVYATAIHLLTWLVSWGSHISNKRNSDHSTPPMRCFWSALRAEKVCTVMPGQSGRRSRSSKRRFVT